MEGVVYNTSVFFNNVYSPEWLEDATARRIIKAIEKGEVLGPNAVKTKALGVIPPEKMSAGTKTLLLMLFMPEVVCNATNCGDNCAPWVLRIAKMHDVTINLYHLMDFGDGSFSLRVANTGDVVSSMAELVPVALACLKGGA